MGLNHKINLNEEIEDLRKKLLDMSLRSKDVLLEDDIGEFEKKEMNAFINHLLEIGYLKLDDGLLKYDL